MPKWEEEFEKNLYNGVFDLDVESGYVTQVDPNKIKNFFSTKRTKLLKDFVKELKDHTVKIDNERGVKVSMVDRLLAKYIK